LLSYNCLCIALHLVENLFEFLAQQWMLVGALLVLAALLIRHESRKAGPSISPLQLTTLINREKALVLDLRPEQEFKSGHITGALNIPHTALEGRMGELEKHRQRPLILVCAIGQNSGAAARRLQAAGFPSISRLQGGIAEWRHQNLPLLSG